MTNCIFKAFSPPAFWPKTDSPGTFSYNCCRCIVKVLVKLDESLPFIAVVNYLLKKMLPELIYIKLDKRIRYNFFMKM